MSIGVLDRVRIASRSVDEESLSDIEFYSESTQIVDALRNAEGNIANAACILGLSYTHLYSKLRNNKELWLVRQEIIDKNLDECESLLMSQVREGNLMAITFYLKCMGKRRGWVEKPLIVGSSTTPLLIDNEKETKSVVDLGKLSTDDLLQLKTLVNASLQEQES